MSVATPRTLFFPRTDDTSGAAVSSVSDGVRLFLDDLRTDIFTFAGSWSATPDRMLAGGTQTTYDGPDGLGEFTILVTGAISFTISGSAPPVSAEHTFTVTIENGSPVEAHFQGTDATTSAFTHRPWYTANITSEALQTRRIVFRGLPVGTSVDYVVTHVYDDQTVLDQPVIVDDTAAPLQYKPFIATTSVQAFNGIYPYGGSIRTFNDYNTVKISFVGTSISVYGIFNPTGAVTGSYQIDNLAPELITYTSTSTDVLPNYLLHSISNLSPGLHTLTVLAQQQSQNQTLNIDYFVYDAAFRTANKLRNGVDNPTDSGLPVGTIVGLAIAVGVVVVTLVFIFCCNRSLRNIKARVFRGNLRRTRRKDAESGGSSCTPDFEFAVPALGHSVSTNQSLGASQPSASSRSRSSTRPHRSRRSPPSSSSPSSTPPNLATSPSSGPTAYSPMELDINAILRSNSPPPIASTSASASTSTSASAPTPPSSSSARDQKRRFHHPPSPSSQPGPIPEDLNPAFHHRRQILQNQLALLIRETERRERRSGGVPSAAATTTTTTTSTTAATAAELAQLVSSIGGMVRDVGAGVVQPYLLTEGSDGRRKRGVSDVKVPLMRRDDVNVGRGEADVQEVVRGGSLEGVAGGGAAGGGGGRPGGGGAVRGKRRRKGDDEERVGSLPQQQQEQLEQRRPEEQLPPYEVLDDPSRS